MDKELCRCLSAHELCKLVAKEERSCRIVGWAGKRGDGSSSAKASIHLNGADQPKLVGEAALSLSKVTDIYDVCLSPHEVGLKKTFPMS